MRQSRRAEHRAGLEGFRERRRDRESKRDYCQNCSTKLRDAAKEARAQQRASTSVPSGPSRITPRVSQRTNPTIPAWPDGSAARHSA
jgi:hypothetical protein